MTEPLCIKRDGIWLVLPYGQPVINADGIQASYDTVQVWTEQEQEAFGLFRPEPTLAPPDGKVETGRTLSDDGGKPIWSVTYGDAPPAPPEPVPETISGRQFWQEAANQSIITQDEAYTAATTGTMPKIVTDAIAQLPAEVQFPAKMKIGSATSFNRHDDTTALLGRLLDKSDAELDSYWSSASGL